MAAVAWQHWRFTWRHDLMFSAYPDIAGTVTVTPGDVCLMVAVLKFWLVMMTSDGRLFRTTTFSLINNDAYFVEWAATQ